MSNTSVNATVDDQNDRRGRVVTEKAMGGGVCGSGSGCDYNNDHGHYHDHGDRVNNIMGEQQQHDEYDYCNVPHDDRVKPRLSHDLKKKR